jgi:hypothetical protein
MLGALLGDAWGIPMLEALNYSMAGSGFGATIGDARHWFSVKTNKGDPNHRGRMRRLDARAVG